ADRPEDRVRTRADGTFELQLVEPGDVVVRAGGGAAGLATAPLRVFGGQVANCTLQLLRGRVLTGRVLLPDGASPADWRVHFVGSPGALPDGTLVRSDGRFELANLPPGVGQLLLAGPVDARLPFATAANARTDGDEVVFDLRATGVPAGLLRLPPDSGAVDLWVWQRESGCGAAARQLPDGSFELGMLASGNYTVVAAGEVFGTVSLGEIWIDGRGVTELGPLSQPSPGELVLPEPVSRGRIELYRRLPELDLCAHLPTLKGGERLRLPAGRWLLLSGEPGAPMAREFEVAAGRVVELDAGAGGPR
ncbi:MAG: carboxypeptidase regulatory-like domain-containing protein, partial [Planctomycetes bacterium]|nr:carboxypeptidase regulatory-like domain-containing protein [Planctomycetota bacterium]